MRYTTLFHPPRIMGLRIFLKQEVRVVVCETHHDGESDTTNAILAPVVPAITCTGMDHVKALGRSIENIAWRNAGVFKGGAFAFSASQDIRVKQVLRSWIIMLGSISCSLKLILPF